VGIKITEIVHVAETEVAGNGTVLTALTEITDEIGLGTQVESHVIIGDLVLGLEAMRSQEVISVDLEVVIMEEGVKSVWTLSLSLVR